MNDPKSFLFFALSPDSSGLLLLRQQGCKGNEVCKAYRALELKDERQLCQICLGNGKSSAAF